jgi:N-methylhydantoinase B
MAGSVKHFIAHFGLDIMKPGDAYITNDPWMGTGHFITTPCFHKGRLVGLFSLHLAPDGHRRHRLMP